MLTFHFFSEYDEEDIADSNPFIIKDYPPPPPVPAPKPPTRVQENRPTPVQNGEFSWISIQQKIFWILWNDCKNLHRLLLDFFHKII